MFAAFRFRLLLFLAALAPISASDASALTPIGDAVELSGGVPDITRFTDHSGIQFQVRLSGLHYVGKAEKTLLEQTPDGSLTIWLALKNMRVTIDRITVSGRPGSAVCGPTVVELGNRRMLWVAFDFERQSHGEVDRLKLKKTRFVLPQDNWSVGSPAWVQTSGFAMSKGKVVRGVREGLVESQSTLEQEILRIAQNALAEFATTNEETPIKQAPLEQALAQKLRQQGHLSPGGLSVFDGPGHTAQ